MGLALVRPCLRVKPTAARARVLAVLADGPPRPVAELAREAACSEAVVRGLLAAGALSRRRCEPRPSRRPTGGD